MTLYINRDKNNIHATMEYNPAEGSYVVKKGSIVSSAVNHNGTFRGASSIEKARGNGVVVGGKVMRDIAFRSASTAANFVTGTSTNGLVAWKDKDGNTLKAIISSEE